MQRLYRWIDAGGVATRRASMKLTMTIRRSAQRGEVERPPRARAPTAPWRVRAVVGLLAGSEVLACRAGSEAWRAPDEEPLTRSGELSLEDAARVPGAHAASSETGPRESLLSLSRGELWATWNALRGDAYELDTVERFLADGERLSCDQQTLVRHGGTHVRYQSSVQVNPAFRERLERFEQLVRDVALEIYGRAPSRLQHFGAYSCRPSRRRSYRVSEHALGNAIDVIGFDFAPARKGEPLLPGLPKPLGGAFRVRVARHWLAAPNQPTAAVHARFLRELSLRLEQRDDVFRVMIGPSRSDHADHFHFDMSPWRYVHF